MMTSRHSSISQSIFSCIQAHERWPRMSIFRLARLPQVLVGKYRWVTQVHVDINAWWVLWSALCSKKSWWKLTGIFQSDIFTFKSGPPSLFSSPCTLSLVWYVSCDLLAESNVAAYRRPATLNGPRVHRLSKSGRKGKGPYGAWRK